MNKVHRGLFVECKDKRRPFLDLLLEASANGTVLSRKDLSDEVNTFMFEVISRLKNCMAL